MLVLGLVPSAPMKDTTLATSGSTLTTSATACWRSLIRSKEASGAASVTPTISPVSCCGKKPLGAATASSAVSATVATALSSVAGWCESTQRSPRS